MSNIVGFFVSIHKGIVPEIVIGLNVLYWNFVNDYNGTLKMRDERRRNIMH